MTHSHTIAFERCSGGGVGAFLWPHKTLLRLKSKAIANTKERHIDSKSHLEQANAIFYIKRDALPLPSLGEKYNHGCESKTASVPYLGRRGSPTIFARFAMPWQCDCHKTILSNFGRRRTFTIFTGSACGRSPYLHYNLRQRKRRRSQWQHSILPRQRLAGVARQPRNKTSLGVGQLSRGNVLYL